MGLDVMINRDPKYQWLKSDEFISLLRNSPHLAWHLSFMRTVKKPRFLLSCCSDIEYDPRLFSSRWLTSGISFQGEGW